MQKNAAVGSEGNSSIYMGNEGDAKGRTYRCCSTYMIGV